MTDALLMTSSRTLLFPAIEAIRTGDEPREFLRNLPRHFNFRDYLITHPVRWLMKSSVASDLNCRISRRNARSL